MAPDQAEAGPVAKLQNFCLEGETLFLSEYVDEPKTHSALFEASIMSAGVWNLRTCTLEGPFCLETAASLLPTTLQQLTLTVYEPPEVSYLSWFERFVALQLLYILGLPDWPGEEQPLVMFEVDGTMPSLRCFSCPLHSAVQTMRRSTCIFVFPAYVICMCLC